MEKQDIRSVEDLVFNRDFRSWVLNKADDDTDAYWQAIQAGDAEKAGIINQSKAIVYALQINYQQLSEEEIDREIERILYKINSGLPELEDEPATGRLRYMYRAVPVWLKVAAVLVIAGLASYFIFQPHATDPASSYNEFVAAKHEQAKEAVNHATKTSSVQLPDGSIVQLEPNSKISYAGFDGDKREVYLVGEAFFEVAKDPAHPFFVYSNNIVTKVLGTSFRVIASEGNKPAAVMVNTGKVSVFVKQHFTDADAKPAELGGTVLLPNQQVTYNADRGMLIKSLVANPVPLLSVDQQDFVFQATPVKQVFNKLEEVYGIRIIADDEAINNCTFSATMGNESLYDKLNLICKSLNASYEIVDGDIVITSVGCKS